MKHLVFILLIFSCLISCKSPQKVVSESKVNQETKLNNDMSSSEDKRVKDLTEQIITLIIHERLNVDFENIRYDTEKPVDSVTGKHPVVEETKINVQKDTSVNKTDSIRNETDSISTVITKDNSQTTVKTKVETKEEKQTGLNGLQKKLIAAGIFSIIGFIAFFLYKIKK